MGFDDCFIFLLRPSLLLDIRVQVVVPPTQCLVARTYSVWLTHSPLATLFANTTRQMIGDLRPLLGTDLTHELDDLIVLCL